MGVKLIKGTARDGGFILPGKIHITRRELEVLSLTASGLDNRELSIRLRISSQSVSNYLSNVTKKLLAKSVAHAVVVAVQNGMMAISLEKSLTGWSPEEYLCCMYCGRAFLWEDVIEVEQKPFVVNRVKYEPPPAFICPYPGCGKNAVDAWTWSDIKKEHPEYARIPERGVIYRYNPCI
jgi:DNA-binding CsgD family transcriptional regulator